MAKRKDIQIIGKRAPYSAEAWARAVEALARQLIQNVQPSNGSASNTVDATKPSDQGADE